MIIGITGGMGCGKSTAARMLSERGFARLDADQLVRERVLGEAEVLAAIREKFGDAVFTSSREGAGSAASSGAPPSGGPENGAARRPLDRAKLAARVFAREADRLWLEALVHPRLFLLWREALLAAPRAQRWVIEVPLLFEKGLENWFDLTVCVASSAAQQIARLEQRGVPATLAEQRIFKQLPLATKLARADLVLWNDGGLSSLEKQIGQMVAPLRCS